MTFKTALVTPASAVASAGTFTASYPTGTTAGSFSSYGHKIFCRGLQAYFAQDDGLISVSFGASSITVTYKGTTPIPAGTTIDCQFDIAGDAASQAAVVGPKRMAYAPVLRLDLGAPVVASSNGISASQSVASGAAFLLNGAVGATLDVPRNVVAAWTTTAILTITGKDEYGEVMVETTASGASHTGKKAFKSITSITTNASITSATVGYGDVLGLPIFIEKAGQIIGELQDGVLLPRRSGKVYIPWEIEQTELLAPTAEQIVCPVAGFIAAVRGIVQGAVTTGGTITVEVNTVAVTGLSFVVADADAAGVRYADTPTTWHGSTTVVAAGDQLTITPSAPFATAGQLNGILEIDILGSALLDGTFVAGVQTTPTGTLGDVRGTYDPSFPCDGAGTFSLLVLAPDAAYRGVHNYHV